jgi:outer membrane protein OmpA-like peptidoglycan-associated protein
MIAIVMLILGLLVMLNSNIRKNIVRKIGSKEKVIVYGHSDIIGRDEGNLKLTQKKVKETKSMISGQGKKDIGTTNNITAIGLDERRTQYTFDNKYPEGRMYNKNVFTEIFENKWDK